MASFVLTQSVRKQLALGLRRIWMSLPRSDSLAKACRMYADFSAGDNNPDIKTNGELRAMQKLLPACEVAFDVGANVGEWAGLALEVNPRMRLHCFEPASGTFAKLASANLPAAQVVLNQFGLGEVAAEGQLHLHGDVSEVNTLHPGRSSAIAAETGTETVRLDTLDAYCTRENISEIDYLKIDVEGHELAVLRGAAGMIGRRAIRYVQVEYSSNYAVAGVLFGDIFALLSGAGYVAHKILPRGLKVARVYQAGMENFQLSNWVFARAGERVDGGVIA